MRIIIVNFEYPPLGGGGGVATKHLAENLAQRHEVTVVTTAHPTLPRQETSNGVAIWRVPVWGRRKLPTSTFWSLLTFVPAAWWRLFHLTRTQQFNVINAQFVLPSGLPAALIARWRRLPLVVSFVGGDVYDPTKYLSPHRHWWLRWLVRRIATVAVAGTAISEDTKRRVQTYHKVMLPITVTPLGIEPVKVMPQTREALGLPEGPLAISIGRLIPRKGFQVLLAVWQKLPGVNLLIVGDGPWSARLRLLAEKLGVRERVHFVGFVTEERKQLLLQAADLYVSGAEHEGFGLVFLEAMDAGLPVVAYNDGGHRDFLVDGTCGVLVPVGDTAALQEAVVRISADVDARARIGQHNRQIAARYYWPAVTKAFEAVLTEAAKTT